MVEDSNKDKNELYEGGLEKGVHYGEIFSYVQTVLNNAMAIDGVNEKRKFLNEVDLAKMHDLYAILNTNPDSGVLAKKQKILENMAKERGLVLTEEGIYLDNKPR